jgi:Rap1a immunity proteins
MPTIIHRVGAIAAMLGLMAGSAHGENYSGKAFLEECYDTMPVREFCQGLVQGVAFTLLTTDKDKRPCYPKQIRISDLIEVGVRFIDRNKNRLAPDYYPAVALLVLAYREAWPPRAGCYAIDRRGTKPEARR